jgi:hypothetical protein
MSTLDGSVGLVKDRLKDLPALTVVGALKVAVGATLLTATVKALESDALSLSVTFTVTV